MKRHVLALVAAVAACVGTARAEDLPLWRNGAVTAGGDSGFLFMADSGGFGKAFGLDYQMVQLRGDPLLLKALIAGQLESYIGGPGSPLIAASKGAPIKIIGCNWAIQQMTFWGTAKITSLQDLKGKTIGISSPGSAPDLFMRAALVSAGVQPGSVTFVAAGGPADLLHAIAAGNIDATATPDEYEDRAAQLGLHVLTTTEKATPLALQRCDYVSTATLARHPDLVARYLAAEIAAYTYSLSHRDETVALSRAITHAAADSPEAPGSYTRVAAPGVIDMSFNPPMDKLRWLTGVLVDSGQIKPGFDPATMIDLGPLAEARKLAAAAGDAPAQQAAASLAKAGVH
jgi:NitT/TauT family transport system substrate-binding protein